MQQKQYEVRLNGSFIAHIWAVSKETFPNGVTGFRGIGEDLVFCLMEDFAKNQGITIQEYLPRPVVVSENLSENVTEVSE